MVSGTTYFAALTSTAPDVQSQAYFIKNDTYISDRSGTAIDPQPTGSNVSAPEPGSVVLIGLGMLVCGIGHRRVVRGKCAAADYRVKRRS